MVTICKIIVITGVWIATVMLAAKTSVDLIETHYHYRMWKINQKCRRYMRKKNLRKREQFYGRKKD